ncbi:MAG: S-adenosyl-l-methionine hydroxide adenosyltransferase family protein [Desulfovibrionaceae bacterium]
MANVIALLTDFGLKDPYVGQMKGTLMRHAPDSPLVDICHEVEPFSTVQAGFFLQASSPHFPRGTVFVAVVDPGVGTPRRIVCLDAFGRLFLAPDNGLLGLVLAACAHAPTGKYARAFDLTPRQRGEAVPGCSATFHGRDLFAPLAARLSQGEPPESLGSEIPLDSLARPAWSEPLPQADGVGGTVLHVDRFGNTVLNLAVEPYLDQMRQWAGKKGELALEAGSRCVVRLATTYEDIPMGEVGLLAGSQGFLELAMRMDSAAALLQLDEGDAVALHRG